MSSVLSHITKMQYDLTGLSIAMDYVVAACYFAKCIYNLKYGGAIKQRDYNLFVEASRDHINSWLRRRPNYQVGNFRINVVNDMVEVTYLRWPELIKTLVLNVVLLQFQYARINMLEQARHKETSQDDFLTYGLFWLILTTVIEIFERTCRNSDNTQPCEFPGCVPPPKLVMFGRWVQLLSGLIMVGVFCAVYLSQW